MAEEPDLRALYQEAGSHPRTPHLDEAGWVELVCRDGGPSARDRALAHVTACAACGQIYRALEMMAAEARVFDTDASAVGSERAAFELRAARP